MNNHSSLVKLTIVALSILLLTGFSIKKSLNISNLRVEYLEKPIGLDVIKPRFSWQMEVEGNIRGYFQTAYQLIVTNPKGKVVWDSKKISSGKSLNILYEGSNLQPETRYTWNVTVWDQNEKMVRTSSYFETGLMNPDPNLSGWDGATWIGGADDDLVLYSPYLSVFKFQYKVKLDSESNSKKAGFIFGANDSRLMDKNKNILWMESNPNESYIKFELDISNVGSSKSGLALFNIYRVGYHPDDKADVPFKTLQVSRTLINDKNKHDEHQVYVEAVFGLFDIYLGGTKFENKITTNEKTGNSTALNLNPMGRGGDYISYPMLAEIGFSVNAGEKASFSEIEIRNQRKPSNVLFSEDLSNPYAYAGIFTNYAKNTSSGLSIDDNAFLIDGGAEGQKIIADPSRNSMPMLRTTFKTEQKKINRAQLYVTARGVYEMYINGQRVGNDYFNPGLTQYNQTHMYQTYDITAILKEGENAIGAMLGEGWWSGNITYRGENWNMFGDRQSLLAKLVVTYADGTKQTITTNPETWRYYNDGPVIYGSFFQGEVYDASKEPAIESWTNAQYDDSKWEKAVHVPLEGTTFDDDSLGRKFGLAPVANYKNMQLIGQIGENAGIVKELTAIAVEEVRPGVFVYDMGQNMVGIPQIKIVNGVANNTITLRYAEVKYPDLPASGNNVGMIMLENIRAALAQDRFKLKNGENILQPHFTFHGYRFLEITGIEKALPLSAVKGKVISSVKELASAYETSNPKVNKLWENITWSMRGNFLSIPTDCPQRNERMGWNGDISVFGRTSTYLTDAAQFLNRHLLNIRNAQREDGRFSDVAPLGDGFGGILWGSAGITVAWEAYQQYNDKNMLVAHYDAMKSYMNYLNSRIDTKTGLMDEGPLGDWLSPEGKRNDNTLFWEAYYVYDLELMSKIAAILGKHEDSYIFRGKCMERKQFFNDTYVDSESGKTIKPNSSLNAFKNQSPVSRNESSIQVIDTQASYAVPLALGVFSEENKPKAAKNLADAVKRKNTGDDGATFPEYSLMTGFIGTASIGKALSDNSYNETIYRLLQQTSYPSWLYSVDQGATTIWERLNSYTVENGFGGNNSMNSFNHYAFGAIGAWMYNYSIGIQSDENAPGFKNFILKPSPDPTGEMTFAKGYYDSMYGRIESGWLLEGNKLTYTAKVPANTTAILYLPASSEKEIIESGKEIANTEGISFIKYENNKVVFELKSGDYKFIFNIYE